jgi:hypothetical protein
MLKGWDLLSDEGRASLCQRDECRLALAVGFGISPVLSDEQWLAALKTKPQTLLEAMLRIKRSAAVIFPVPPSSYFGRCQREGSSRHRCDCRRITDFGELVGTHA